MPRRGGVQDLRVVRRVVDHALVGVLETSLPGLRVKQVLEQLKEMRGLPASIPMDNSPDFVGKVLDAWACEADVTLLFSLVVYRD